MKKINLEDKKTWRLILIVLACLGLAVAFLFVLNNRYYFQPDQIRYFDRWTGTSKLFHF